MKTIKLDAAKDGQTEITCLRLKSIYLCAELYKPVYIVFGEGDTYREKLEEMGYTVTESEVDLPLQEDTFSEFSFTCFDDGFTTVYLFDGIAVIANLWMIEYLCQEGLTFADVKEHWEDDVPEESDETIKLTITNDALGALAVKMDQLHFDCMEHIYCPDEEIEVEERLEHLRDTYELLQAGETPSDFLDEYRELVEADIQSCECTLADLPKGEGEDHACHEEQLAYDRKLLERIKELEQTPLPMAPQQNVSEEGDNAQ